MKISKIIIFISSCFSDLIGQNRLGNNLTIHRLKKFANVESRSLLIALIEEMSKTREGRKIVKGFMKNIKIGKKIQSRRRARNFRN